MPKAEAASMAQRIENVPRGMAALSKHPSNPTWPEAHPLGKFPRRFEAHDVLGRGGMQQTLFRPFFYTSRLSH